MSSNSRHLTYFLKIPFSSGKPPCDILVEQVQMTLQTAGAVQVDQPGLALDLARFFAKPEIPTQAADQIQSIPAQASLLPSAADQIQSTPSDAPKVPVNNATPPVTSSSNNVPVSSQAGGSVPTGTARPVLLDKPSSRPSLLDQPSTPRPSLLGLPTPIEDPKKTWHPMGYPLPPSQHGQIFVQYRKSIIGKCNYFMGT